MRALCFMLLWIFGACSDASPQLIENETQEMGGAPQIDMDISDIDNARTRCIVNTINTMFGPMCIKHELRFDYTYNLPGTCNDPGVAGCTHISHNVAYIYIAIDVQRRPLQIYVGDPIGDYYVHEMTHVESYCLTGNPDKNHTQPIWGDEIKLKFTYAKKLATEAGCYNL